MFAEPPLRVDPDALVGWADCPSPSHHYDQAWVSSFVAAAGRGVAVGAHPSYRDAENFGRVEHDLDREEVARIVAFQLIELDMAARRHGSRVRYVKPHGALYNRIVHDREQAAGVVDAVLAYAAVADEDPLPILGLPGAAVLTEAEKAGVRAVTEAFADRAYTPAGTLVPRGTDGAVLSDSAEIARRVVELVTTGRIGAIDGTLIDVDAGSVCLHGDTPGAVGHAQAVRDALTAAGIVIGAPPA